MPKAKERDGVFQRADRSGWFVSYIDSAGTRRKRKVEASTRTQALNSLSAIKHREERDRILGVKAPSEITLKELLERYKRHQRPRVKGTTFKRLDGVIAVLLANLPDRIKSLTRKDVADYISFRSESVAPATIFKEVTTLKHVLRLAVEWELLNQNVAQGARLPKAAQGRTRYLTPVELKSALEAAPEWLRAPLALAAFTGMRRGELLGLRWGDVDLGGSRLYLRATKNGTLRVLALNALAVQVLSTLPVGSLTSLVFPGIDPMRLTDRTRHLFERLGIEGASLHTTRHTFASWLVMEGCDLYAVGQALGHKSPQMTQRYAHLSPGYMAAAVGKLDVVFGNVLPSRPASRLALPSGPA